MNERIHIHGGRLFDPAGQLDTVADLFIAAGKILAIGEPPDGFSPDRVIDATDRLVIPGLVDIAARLREPGQEHKANIASEARAAAAGGITTVCCLPDTDPAIDTPAVVELIRRRAKQAGHARVVTLGALTQNLAGEHLSEMAALKTVGCCGVTNLDHPIRNTQVLRRAMEYAASFDMTLFVHPEDHWLADGGCVHEGPVATRLGLPGIPSAAETAAVAQHLALIEQTGIRAHFCRLSTGRAVQLIARAQYDGLPVTMDVAAPYLYFSDLDVSGFDSLCHVRPPFRSQQDRDALRSAVARGTVSCLCSDHQPHEADAKQNPFPSTQPGISGLDTLLGLTLKLVNDGLLSLKEAVARVTIGPARVLGLDHQGVGSLTPGKVADVTLLDLDAPWQVNGETLHSHGHNTPFLGWELSGRVTHTLVDGRMAFSTNE